MDKENETTDKAIKQALDWMDAPDALTDEDIRQLEEEADFKQACKEVLECKTATRKEFSKHAPDIDREWNDFKHKHTARHTHRLFYWKGAAAGIAATVLLIFAFSWIKSHYTTQEDSVKVFTANDKVQEVTLQTAHGAQLALTSSLQSDSLKAIGATLSSSTDTLGLVYNAIQNEVQPETHILSTPRGQDFRVVLGDGSIVWLNAESRLEYPSQFTGKERKVRLHGEAYFQIAPNKESPFIVETQNMSTRVLGTEFNLCTYTEHNAHVTLIKGSVEVKSYKGSGHYVRITPGEDAHLQPDGTFTLKEVDIDSYVYWKEGFFYFDNVPLVDIMQSIGRWYNINVVFYNKEAMNYKMHYLCDRKGGIEHAVELFNMMRKVKVELKDQTLYIR